MPITLDGTLGITTPSYGGADAAEYLVPVTAFKNRIINGNMTIDQRNAGASVNARDNVFPVDRFKFMMVQNDKATGQQSSVVPAGFRNSLLITSTAATSVGANDDYSLQQPIEGFNVADLGWGTANAQSVTLSFWVRSSLTGQFGGALKNSANNRSYPYSYTISAANTWEQKSVTIAGDTSGTWLTTNGVGINVLFDLGSGSSVIGTAGSWSGSNFYGATGDTRLVATNGATFYITGVQLEVGTNATFFDARSYGTELALCQRYYQVWRSEQACCGRINGTSQVAVIGVPLSVAMRATPTFSSGNYNVWQGGNTGSQQANSQVAVASTYTASSTGLSVAVSGFSGRTDDLLAVIIPTFGNNIGMSAEL